MRDIPRGALGEVDGDVLQVTKTQLLLDEVTGATQPGTALRRDGERLVVQCGDGPLELIAWIHKEPIRDRPEAPPATAER